MRFYSKRIAQLNPGLNAVNTVNRSVRAQARIADRRRSNGDDCPMLGIPVIVNTTGMPTAASSLDLKDITSPDACVFKRLRAQEALSIGKAHLRMGELSRLELGQRRRRLR